jgi:hypothetical protein
MQNYKLFLDDIRVPLDCTKYNTPNMPKTQDIYKEDWVIVRSYNEFVDVIKEYYAAGKTIETVSFDHDLADFQDNVEYTGKDCAKWLVAFCIDNNISFPKCFVHSANTVGAIGIMNTLNDYFKYQNFR